MNNKKIIFGIVLFLAISFIAYTFASPIKDESGTLVNGTGTNSSTNNPNNSTNKDKDDNDDDIIQKIDDDKTEEENNEDNNSNSTNGNTSTNNNSSNNGNNTYRPSNPTTPTNPSNPSTPTNPTTPTVKRYLVKVNVSNGKVDVNSQNPKEGESATFIVTPNTGYTLDGASISGNNCSLDKNTGKVTVNNVHSDTTCTVTMAAEPIYTTLSTNTSGAKINKLSATHYEITGELPEDLSAGTNTAKVSLNFIAPKVFTDSELANKRVEFNGRDRTDKISIYKNSAGIPMFSYTFNVQTNDSYSVFINWGKGNGQTYIIDFKVNVKKTH